LSRVFPDVQRVDRRAHAVEVHRMAVGDFDQRAATEVDAHVQAADREEDDGQHERDEGDHVEREREPHERDVALDAEEFHVGSLVLRERGASVANECGITWRDGSGRRGFPDLPDGNPRQVLAACRRSG
jgi:hypothetical protein